MARPDILIAGRPTVKGTLFEPRIGVWWASVEYVAEEVSDAPIGGSAVLDFFDDVALTGTVSAPRAVNDEGIVSVRLDGGSGQLDLPLEAAHFRNLTRGTLVKNLTQISGDILDASASAELLAVRLPHWTRPRTLGHRYLSDIAEHGRAVWRILRNGNLWLGVEAWPELDFEHTLVSRAGSGNGVTIQPESAPLLRPGVTFLGRKVAEVVTKWTDNDLRQQATFEDGTPGYHTRAVQQKVVDWQTRTIGTDLELGRKYSCRVDAQSADLTRVDIRIDSRRISARGMQGVPVRYGMPGVKARLKPGARCLVGWENADPSRPFVSIWRYQGIEEVFLEPELNANAGIKTTGSGVSSLVSDSKAIVNAPDVELGDTPGSPVARRNDLVMVTLPVMQAGPYPVVSTGAPSPFQAAGQIVTGKIGVKA